jgi:WhiB family redox-sensing transcriptional regulator
MASHGVDDLDWRQQGACIGHDPDIWFPRDRDKHKREQATQICRGCPVNFRCAEEALKNAEPYGIWGTITEAQRALILDTNAKAS